MVCGIIDGSFILSQHYRFSNETIARVSDGSGSRAFQHGLGAYSTTSLRTNVLT
jgi:hypothetical protein